MENDQEKDFNSFYMEYFPKIFKYTFFLLGNHEEAEQLTQETFKKLIDYFLSNTSIKSHKAIAYRIAGNSCVDYLRREKKTKEILNQISAMNSSQDDPTHKILKEQRIGLIRKALLNMKAISSSLFH